MPGSTCGDHPVTCAGASGILNSLFWRVQSAQGEQLWLLIARFPDETMCVLVGAGSIFTRIEVIFLGQAVAVMKMSATDKLCHTQARAIRTVDWCI
jgi:hypothetical protein